ncbi:MAG: hypothetical protein IJX47_06160 [Clostridia bacterium]|nr:hypothetical protein [Clostridia bacterium]
MNYNELLLAISLIVFATVIYVMLRKFISWAIKDDNKFYKKRGGQGLSKGTINAKIQTAYDKLSTGYALVVFLLVLYIIKLVFDATY